jgi:hypothetical protein
VEEVIESTFIEERHDVAHRYEAIIGSREKKTCCAIYSILIPEGDSREGFKKTPCVVLGKWLEGWKASVLLGQ